MYHLLILPNSLTDIFHPHHPTPNHFAPKISSPPFSSPLPRYILSPVQNSSPLQHAPTRGLYLGLVITVLAVLAYAAYITFQFAGIRKMQSGLVDRNRRDSLQLLRIQNDLNSLGLAMRDMQDPTEPYPIIAWVPQFERIRTDLEDAIEHESALTQATPTSDQLLYLNQSLAQFWDSVNRMFSLAQAGFDSAAAQQIRDTLQPRQAALSSAVSRLLVQNNEAEERATLRISAIYDRVQRQLYFFLAAILVAIVFTSLYLIRNNRRLFAQVAELSSQRSDLAQKLIATQESTLRHISRELHDEFGQVLTAIGSLIRRTSKNLSADSPVHADLQEVQGIAQSTLDNIRSLSQALHPVLLDETGLVATLDWYIPTVERQTGLVLHYEKSGETYPVGASAGVQIYRILQEALNNVARHSGAKEAWIRLRFEPAELMLEIEDHGKGFRPAEGQTGIGLVAMRERAEILGGSLKVSLLPAGGTIVQLQVPREQVEIHVE